MLDLLLGDGLPTESDLAETVNRFVDRVLRFYYIEGENFLVVEEDELIQSVEVALKFVLHFKGPSGFKVASAFILALASRKPFKTPLPAKFDPIRTEQNIIIGIFESLYWLNGAELMTLEGAKRIEKSIHFSDHYFTELVHAISFACQNFQGRFQEADDRSKAGLVALIFEAVTYKTNDHLSYKINPIVDEGHKYFPALDF